MKKSLKQIIILFSLLTLVVTTSNFLNPPKVQAQETVTDPFNGVFNALSSVANGSTAGSEIGQYAYTYVIKPMAISILKIILQQLTLSIVNWINTGFNGSPS